MLAMMPSLPSFAAAAQPPMHDRQVSHEPEQFALPISDPMRMDNRTLCVCNTFMGAFRQGLDSSIGHDMGKVFQEALDVTLTEHSFPKQPFRATEVMETLVDAGLSMPAKYLPEDLKHFGNDFRPATAEIRHDPAQDRVQFDAADLLVAQVCFDAKLQKDSRLAEEVRAKRERDAILHQQAEMRDLRAQRIGAPRPSMPGGGGGGIATAS